MTRAKHPEKTADLPPKGKRNADPITDAPGAHPIETGVGAALGGAATGLAVGAAAGPVGAAIGAAAGAIAGGLAGKGVGELIDPTTDDNWLRETFGKKKYARKGDTYDTYVPAYRYGGEVQSKYHGRKFDEVESDLRTGWEKFKGNAGMAWDRARDAVRDAYDRTLQLREERLKVHKTSEKAGEVKLRKEVVTETKNIQVPVEREEIVIERHKVAGGKAVAGDIRAEEIRIPVKEERVHVSKEAVVTEEVSVGKRKVQDTQHVTDTVKKERLVVKEEGKAHVQKGKTHGKA